VGASPAEQPGRVTIAGSLVNFIAANLGIIVLGKLI
jgi:hypothetical protein